VGQDAAKGDIYLPLEELQQFQVDEEDILNGKSSPAFHALMTHHIERAEQHFHSALRLMPRKARRGIGHTMAILAMALLKQIKKEGVDAPLTQYITLAPIYQRCLVFWTRYFA
jgi:phytoene synthase